MEAADKKEPKCIEVEQSLWAFHRYEIIGGVVAIAAFIFVAVCPDSVFEYLVDVVFLA